MTGRGGWAWRVASGALGVAALIGGVSLLLAAGGRPPEGPVPIAWDREVCAECHMHIGDPRFAAQVQTREGNVHDFDDPGCLYRWLDRAEPDVHAVWLRHADRDGWIDAREAAFVEREPTPMGYGLGAVPRGTPGSFDDAEARRRVRARHRHRRHEP